MTTLAGLTPDWWTAIGTLALAAVTVGAVVVSIVLARQESRRTDERIDRQMGLAEKSRRKDQQLRQAWAVVVLPRNYATGPDERNLGVYVANRGDSTITKVKVMFSVGGQRVKAEQRSVTDNEEDDLIGHFDTRVYDGILPPRAAFVFMNETIFKPSEIADWFPIVRWQDWDGQVWENNRGEVRQVKDGDGWAGSALRAPLDRSRNSS
jgi:hypothetical protein